VPATLLAADRHQFPRLKLRRRIDRVIVEIDPERQVRVIGPQPHVDAAIAVGNGPDEGAGHHHLPPAEAPVRGVGIGVIGLEQLGRSDRHRLILHPHRIEMRHDRNVIAGSEHLPAAPDAAEDQDAGPDRKHGLAVALELFGGAAAPRPTAFAAGFQMLSDRGIGRGPAARAEFAQRTHLGSAFRTPHNTDSPKARQLTFAERHRGAEIERLLPDSALSYA